MSSAGVNLVDEILNANDSLAAEVLLNNSVISERDSTSVHFSIASFVDKIRYHLVRGVTIGYVRLNLPNHIDCGLVQSHEHSVVELSQSQQLQDLPALGV